MPTNASFKEAPHSTVRTYVKLLFWLSGGISALLAVLVAFLFLVDVNLYRAQIERHVSAAFGRAVVFDGPLELKRSLIPRFVVKGLKISNPEWASRPFLATVDKFDIRVSLLHLLKGDLQIYSLEFYGVDLLLEKTSGDTNNFTFGEPNRSAALPAIEHMSLYDASIAYAAPEGPVRHLQFEQVTARKVPGQPVTLEAHAVANAVPVKISLQGKPTGEGRPNDPWQFTLLGEADNTILQLDGSVADPTDFSHGEYRLDLKGRHPDVIEALTGVTLPKAGPFELSATIRFKFDAYLTISDFTGHIGGSDIHGNLDWDKSATPPAIKARLESQQLDTGDLGFNDSPGRDPDEDKSDYPDKPFDIGLLGDVDLDVEVRVQRLDGLAKPVQDILLTAHADRRQLELAVVKATVNDTNLTARTVLPWGKHLTTSASGSVNLEGLLHNAELELHAQAPKAVVRYATTLMGRPLNLALSTVEVTARPGAPLSIAAEAALNDKPVMIKLQAEPLAELAQRVTGPWQDLTLKVRGDDISLDATGNVARPFEVGGFDISYSLNGSDIDAFLPLQGAWSLTGHYADNPDRSVFDKLKVTLGRSDVGGRVAVYPGGQRPRLAANLDSSRIHLDEILSGDRGATPAAAGWDRPLDIGGLGAVDLDVEVRVGQLEGMRKPMQDILLHANTSEQSLTLELVQATLDGTHLEARVGLPWGERLAALGQNGISIQGLAHHADLAMKARLPDGKLRQQTNLMGHPVELGLTGLEATARPGEALQVSAGALLNDVPIQANLKAEPLAEFLKRPTGPWQNLALDMQKGDIRFHATGRVERPFEASGFNVDYGLSGTEINTLLPVFDLILPLEGAYSLTGHFADLPDRLVFDELKIISGDNDISGDISVYQDKQRPTVVANLSSEQIYLSTLLPVSETETAPGTEHHVIPDYNLPIERMREIDGALTFKGKRLRTTAGDLGDISFKATLQDGVFRMDPFRVRGWAGALIESDGLIDASQDPPIVQWQWIARQLNYGVLLEQADFAETVEGEIDITLHLSGSGRTRHEFLGDADGQLIIVGQDGKFGSRQLDLWGSDLVTTMLSSEWRSQDVTNLNCMAAHIGIEDGVASSDKFIVDTQRITIAATGTLDLESEALNLVIAPRPKRTSLVSLTNPVRVTGTLAAPEITVTRLPRNRLATAGTGLLAGLINPGYLIFAFSQTGSGQANACEVAVAE